MSFQVMVAVDAEQGLENELVLPLIFRNKIPRPCNSMKLVNYRGRKFRVRIQKLRNRKMKIVGEQRNEFVNEFEFPDITTLCFIWLKNTNFLVRCFDSEGVEYRVDPVRGVTIHGCFAEATEETFVSQELPPLFLVECNNRRRKCENLTARIVGPKHASAVDVTYNFPENEPLGHAIGFEGNKWTFFCLQNEIEVGHTLMFTDMRGLTFNLDLFTAKGVGIDNPPLCNEEEVDDPNYSEHVMGNAEEEGKTVMYEHRCCHFQHGHNSTVPHFFKKFEIFFPHRNNLTIPKDFVREHDLHSYSGAILHFGKLVFCWSLEVHLDRCRGEDKNHLVLVTDWVSFMKKTGVIEGRILRFQINESKSFRGQLVDFDVC